MRTHVVQDGDCIASIAARFGVSPGDLWQHPQNAGLRERRRHPGVLRRGDVVTIPDPAPGLTVSPGSTHRFTAARATVELRLSLADEQGRAAANVPYRLVVDGRAIDGTTDGGGSVVERVPASAVAAELILDPDGESERRLAVRIGGLDPIDDVGGVKQRLRNLGYDVPETSDVETRALREALRVFQRDQGLDPTGALDDATRRRLGEAHGS